MADVIVNEKQLQKIQELVSRERDLKLAEENWGKFTQKQKDSIVECLKVLYPEKVNLIKEAAWYNTLGDVIGLFDPTGVVDLVNGISYISQGDNLFGFLSIISAVPYLGDVVAKPVMAALKIGSPSAKALEGVMKLVKNAKNSDDLAKAAKELERISSYGGLTTKFVQGFGKVAGKLRGYIERMPLGVFKGFKKTILQWFDLFEKAAKSGSAVRKQGADLATKIRGIPVGSNAVARLSKADQIKQLTQLTDLAKKTPGLFTGYRTTKGVLSWKTLFRGVPQLMGRNASVRALMRQTKWWAGFLDYIGFGNFVGPDELLKKMGENDFINKMNEYNNTTNARQNYEADFGPEQQTRQGQAQQQTTSTNKVADPFANFLNKLFSNAVNPLPGV